jgi:two-component system chemotaxis response regulator CheB
MLLEHPITEWVPREKTMQGPGRDTPAAPPLFPQAAFDLVAIGASAGGILVIKSILSRLPISFPTPIAIVQHQPQEPRSSLLAQVLGFRARLQTNFAQPGDRLRSGTVFIAPPACHLTVSAQRRFELEHSPKLNWVRPAADRLFMTAASSLGSRVLCVVLTGMGCDGAAGAAAIKQCGGLVIVQDPHTAQAEAMPQAAIETCRPDLVLPPDAIPTALTSLCEVIGTRALFCGTFPPLYPRVA